MSKTIKCPEQAGMFVGDAFFGDPEDSGRATHRWEGVQWESIPADVETLCLLVAKARVQRDDLRARLSELERENARMRAALETIRDRHIPDQPMADDSDEAEYARKHHTGLRIIAQRALAGSGEK